MNFEVFTTHFYIWCQMMTPYGDTIAELMITWFGVAYSWILCLFYHIPSAYVTSAMPTQCPYICTSQLIYTSLFTIRW